MPTSSSTLQTEAQQALDDLCSKLGSLGDECKTLVDSYFPQIWQLLINKVDPDSVCSAIGLCKSSSIKVRTNMYICIPYSEKLSREKTFTNFTVLYLYISKRFFVDSRRYERAIHESFLCKIPFFTNSRKIPATRYKYTRVLPSLNIRLGEWAWFGRSLSRHQRYDLPHQRNTSIEGIGGHHAERDWGRTM